jgi:uncharacterized protein YjdB
MKRQIFTLLLCALFGAVVMAQAPSHLILKTTTLPVIDGQIDEVWDVATALDIAVKFKLEEPTLGALGETYWKALWTDAGIYFLVNVTDDEFYPVYKSSGNDYEFDKLEVYFDVNADKKDGLGAGGNKGHYQIAPGFAEATIDGTELLSGSGDAECHYAFLVTEPNYVAEYFVPMTKFIDKDGFQIAQTAEIGFDITVIDRETGDPGRKRMNWANAGALDESWNNMDDAGILTLDGASDNILAEAITIATAGDATTITTEAGTLQFTAAILPVSATVKTAKWTVVNGTGRASISADGILTAIMDGTVTVTGETKDGSYLSGTKEITISNQFISMSDINEIKNGNFNQVNGDGTATLWGGWGGPSNSAMPRVVDGVAVCTPALGANNWEYQFNQQNLNAMPNVDYVFSFTAWADAPRTMCVDFEDTPALNYNRYGISTDPTSNGRSEWTFDITTEPTTYTLHVNFDQIVAGTVQKVQYMLGLAGDIMYLDNITLVQASDLALVGVEVASLTVTSPADVITVDKGTLQMGADVLPVDAGYKAIAWSVANGTGMATIDAATGLLTAFSNGTVTVTATSKDGSFISATKVITLSNQVNEILNVNVAGAGFVAGDRVFVTGDFAGWSEPGKGTSVELFDEDGDGIFTAIMSLGHQEWKFKFFKNVTWAGGEPVPADRAYTFVGGENLTFNWGVPGVISVPKNTLEGKVQMYPNPVSDDLTITTSANLKSVVISSMLGQVVNRTDLSSRVSATISTASLAKGMYIVTFFGTDGSQMSQKLMKQ